jgi:hypothetical protein
MSESKSSSSSSSGIGFVGLLTILFIGLKLTGYIDWSWLWVLSPLWIGFALWIAFFALIIGGGALLMGGGLALEWWDDRKRARKRFELMQADHDEFAAEVKERLKRRPVVR